MKQRLGVRRKISFVAALSVLLVFSLNAAGRCGLERMVNFGITLPLGEFAEKDKGLALAGGCLGAGLVYDFGSGVALCGNFNYRHFGADLLSDSLGGSWRVLSLTDGLRLSRGMIGPYIPYLELGGGTFWPDLKVSTPTADSSLCYESSLGLCRCLGLKSAGRGGGGV